MKVQIINRHNSVYACFGWHKPGHSITSMGLTFNTYQTFFKISKILHVCIPGGININIKNKRNKNQKAHSACY